MATNYATLSSQISIFQTQVNNLSSATLAAQDLVFLAKAIEAMGNLLGVNDVLAATNTQLTAIQNASSGAVTSVNSAAATQVAAIGTAVTAGQLALQQTYNNYVINANMGAL